MPSISGAFPFQKSSDIQEVPNWSVNRSISREQSSEDEMAFLPGSQENGSFTPQKTAGNNSTENYFIMTRNLGNRNNHYEDTGQPPPALVRNTILQQDAQFREQVQELHRVYEVQVFLMAEMRKRFSAEVATTTATCASVNANNEKPWAMTIQAPLSKTEYQDSGSGFQHGQAPERDHIGKGGGYISGGRKPGRRRTFDLEKPPDENMDEDDEEPSGEAVGIEAGMETEELRLRLSSGWAQQAGDPQLLHQDHLHTVPSRSDDIPHEAAPVCPTPTTAIATQSFLGGLWGLSLEKKSEARGDCQPADVSSKKEHRSLPLDIDDNHPPHHPTKMASSPAAASPSEASQTGTTLTRPPQQQYPRNEATCCQEQQQQHTWAHSAEGVYQVPPAIGIQSPPQTYAPFKITNETMMLFPASGDGRSPASGFAPPVHNQAYTLAAAAVPVQLHPYEGLITLPRQGLVVSAMNAAAWYSPHSVPPAQQGGWQPVNAFQADSGAIYAFPTAAAAAPLAFNVDLSGGSWTAAAAAGGNSGPAAALSPFGTIVQLPLKVPFKKPPKLVLRQDGTTKEVRLFSPKKDHSPSSSSGEEVGWSRREKDDSQGEGNNNPFMRDYEGQGGGGSGTTNRAFAGWVPKPGAKREREQTVSADRREGEGKSASRTVGKSQYYGDEACLSDGSGSGSGETGAGNVINPWEQVGRILSAGDGEGVNLGEPGSQQERQASNAAERWKLLPSTDECGGDVTDVNEDNNKRHHQDCQAPKPQQSSGNSKDPAQNATGESIALLESTSKTGSTVEENTVPDAAELSSPKDSRKSSPQAPGQDSCTTNEDEDHPGKFALPGSCPVPKVPPEVPAASSALTASSPTACTSFHDGHKPEAESFSASSLKEILGDAADSVHM